MQILSRADRISLAQARRIALSAQGFGEPRPAMAQRRHVARVAERLGLFQIDSINVLARAHTMPLFSRLGPYDHAWLDEAAYDRRRRSLFEYWGHEASLIRHDLQPLLRWRMARAERGEGIYRGLAQFGRERTGFIGEVLREIHHRGPLAAREITGGGKGQGSWWGWSDGKRALEWLFWAGRVTTARRRDNFERIYDLTERVLPAAVTGATTPSPDDAQRALVRFAAQSLGVATEPDLRDYFRLEPAECKARVAELVEDGKLLPVAVEGWPAPAYRDPAARRPRRIEARALVSPFDPLVWDRGRTERLFGFRYRIEIYTPADRREHGYYALPFLFGERLVGRIDLKAERDRGRLLVRSITLEPHAGSEVGRALEAELATIAAWLKLPEIEFMGTSRPPGIAL